MNEHRALAIAISNLKRPGPKELVLTAKALSFLRDMYGSTVKVSAAVGVSDQIIREFLGILTLPPSVLALIESRAIGTLEQSKKLVQLSRSRRGIVDEAAGVLVGMRAHDARAFVNFLVRHPASTVTEALTAVRNAAGTVRDEYHVVVVLNKAEFDRARSLARLRSISPNTLVTELIAAWLAENEER